MIGRDEEPEASDEEEDSFKFELHTDDKFGGCRLTTPNPFPVIARLLLKLVSSLSFVPPLTFAARLLCSLPFKLAPLAAVGEMKASGAIGGPESERLRCGGFAID